jgi:dephospho-CoA kinase
MPEQAKARDYPEIENIEKAGPMGMASYSIVNEGTMEEFKAEIEKFLLGLTKKVTVHENA